MSFVLKYEGKEINELLDKASTALQEHQDISFVATKNELNELGKTVSDLSQRVDELDDMGANIKVDATLSDTSINPVQNKVVTQSLNEKVDKERGKRLSTNDYTDEDKNKLASLSNYDDSAVYNRIQDVESTIPTKVSSLENDSEYITQNELNPVRENADKVSEILGEDGYVYSNGEKVDMRFTRSLLPVGTSIPANANLNTIQYLKIGKYYCSLNVDAETITNCPVKVAFSMEVFNPLGTNVDDETTKEYTYRLRVLTQYDSGTQYMQFCKTSGTAGTWTYNGWYVVPRTSFSLASSKNGGSAAKGATNRGVYIDSTGTFQQMSYTVAKNVPSSAVFTDTNTKVTSVENHYAPVENDEAAINAPDGECITGLKRDVAGHIVGVVSSRCNLDLIERVDTVEQTVDTLVGGNSSSAIESFNEIIAFLESIEDSNSLDAIIAAIEQQIATKQDIITDIYDIRTGATLGATALQSIPASYATTDYVDDKIETAISSFIITTLNTPV